MSLRARLLIGLVVLTAAGLVIAGIVTYAAERSFLVSRVDQQFNRRAINGFEDYVDAPLGLRKGPPAGRRRHASRSPPDPAGRAAGGPGGTLTGLPLGTLGIYVAANGTASRPSSSAAAARRRRSSTSPRSRSRSATLAHPQLVTVDSKAGSALQYRVLREAQRHAVAARSSSRSRSATSRRRSPACATSS